VVDPSHLPECTPACGSAHCLPAAQVPPAQQKMLASCQNGTGFCAPDSMIKGGGEAVPASCTSIAGAEGRCLSTCLPQIAAQAGLLPTDSCAAGEKCAPCFNPTAADPTAPTGACGIACDKPAKPPTILTCPWSGPDVIDPNTLLPCSPNAQCSSGAHCMPAAYVPPAQQGQLAACPGGFCLPDPLIKTAGNYVPPNCSPFNGTPAEGRCMSECLPQIDAQASQLHQHTCPNGDLCAPCYDPFKGTATGACTSSACDKPANPPYTFPQCCPSNGSNQGTCVPQENVPSSEQGNLQQLSCPAQLLCVPDEMLPGGTVQTCSIFILGKGTCLSNCLNLPWLTGIFGQGTCASNHRCIPCSVAPAGTPGC
jgi:hypothetical protein